MKICFLVGTLARGGAEKQLVYMLRALSETGIPVKVLSLTRGESYEKEIHDLGISVEWTGASPNRAARLVKIAQKLREARADIVQSSHFYTNIYAALAGKFQKITSVGAIRSDLIYEMASHKITGRWQISLPAFLIANSVAGLRRAVERGIAPDKIEIVRNVVETDLSNGGATKKNTARKPLKILFAGRLDENKKPQRFVRLAAILTRKFPQESLQFLIAGDGALRAKLENLAREFELSPDRLQFLGVCTKMSEIYEQADLLVSTSEREGTPNVLLEAMAHGLPIVATNVGGTSEILDETRGILIQPNDEAELTNAVVRLIVNRDLRIAFGAAGRKYVRENHSLAHLKIQLPAIYEKLLRTGKISL